MTDNDKKRHSKFLSYILRHHPEVVDIQLDEHGWADVDELLMKLQAAGHEIAKADLIEIVVTNAKQRFSLDGTQSKIRANQGHSIVVDVELEEKVPPPIVYHGTAEQFLPEILSNGLSKMQRRHVHLSSDRPTAKVVGSRHGKPVVLIIKAEEMNRAGHSFFLSKNGVWLTEHVPVEFLSLK